MEKIQNYINGKFVAPKAGNYFDNIEPSKGVAYSLIPDSQTEDVEAAMAAAQAAFPSWSGLSIDDRGDWMMKLSEGIAARMTEIVEAESRDNGKRIKLAERSEERRVGKECRSRWWESE